MSLTHEVHAYRAEGLGICELCVREKRIAELEAALRAKQDQWEAQCKKTIELEAELAEVKRRLDARYAEELRVIEEREKAEAEVERLKAANKTLAWKVAQCTEAAEKAEAEVERVKEHLAKHCPPGLEDICMDLKGEASP